MIRVLQVVNDMHRAGLETMLMNYYRNIDRGQIQFDFLTHRPEKSDYDDEIIELGGKIYYAPRLYPQNYPRYFGYMKNFWKEHPEYKLIHSHIDSMSYLPLLTAKRAEIPVRIAHSHNTSIDRDFKYPLKQFFRMRINSVANYRCACGQEAGEFLFGRNTFTVIPNAIENDKFIYDPNLRKRKRKELGLQDNEIVIGHVGRLSYQKNHKFLLKIFAEILKKNTNSRLLLVGTGEKETLLKQNVRDLHIDNKVLFLGNRSDVSELYQVMDVFVMPSFFEGIPVVGIEAQFAGVPCLFSDKVPEEVKFDGRSEFLSLNKSPAYWAKKTLELAAGGRIKTKNLDNSLYNINNAHYLLEEYYTKLYYSIEH